MTWNNRDLAKQKRRHPQATAAPQEGASSMGAAEAPPWQRATPPQRSGTLPPDQLPTLATEMYWLGGEADDEDEVRYTMEEERALNHEGMCTPQQWDIWSRIATRGIVSL